MESKEKITFSRYGKSFQEQLCMVILDDRPFADQIEEVGVAISQALHESNISVPTKIWSTPFSSNLGNHFAFRN